MKYLEAKLATNETVRFLTVPGVATGGGVGVRRDFELPILGKTERHSKVDIHAITTV